MMRMTAAMALLAIAGACATSPAPAGWTDDDYPDTEWGDEYEGLHIDREAPRQSERGARMEWIDGDSRRFRADARANRLGIRVRATGAGETGSACWRGSGGLEEITAGHMVPASADGVLLGDPRTGSDLRAPTSVETTGLRLSTPASPTSAAQGAGVVTRLNRFRIALAGWRVTGQDDRIAFASVEHRSPHSVIGVAGGAAARDGPSAVSLFASHHDGIAFTGGELAVASGRARAVARVVAGTRREWSAIAIAGAGPVDDRPLVFTRRERWGAALERRDEWERGTSRTGVSSLTRRSAETEVLRRRVFWDGAWVVSGRARVEAATRFTRETGTRATAGALAALPGREVTDDRRARLTLRTRHTEGSGWRLENAYRLEWVQSRSGRPGTVVTWTGKLAAGPVDVRLSASAHALDGAQRAWSLDLAPPGSGEFAAVSGRGASMTGALRVRLGAHAWLGAAGSKRPPAASRLWITAGLRV